MAVSTANLPRIQKFRRFIGDYEALNVLDGARECTDEEIQDYLEDAVDEINFTNPPETNYTVSDFPSFTILRTGAAINYLVSKGILSARNMLSYSDPSGITVRDEDKYGRYVNWYNVLVNKHRAMVMNFKRGRNIDSAYGGVGSELDQGLGWMRSGLLSR